VDVDQNDMLQKHAKRHIEFLDMMGIAMISIFIAGHSSKQSQLSESFNE
jgi:hypothetical protein